MVIHIDTAPHQEHLLTGEQVPARRVHLLHERSRRVIVASLCGIWFDAPVRAGLYVALWHVREAFAPRRIVVDGEHGIVLVAPTHLLSGSVVAKASFCARRSLFDELFAAPLPERMINRNAVDINNTNKNGASAGGQGASAVSGQMMHELFQRALVANDFSDSALATSTGAIVRSYLVDLYAASLSDADALRFMAEAAPRVRQFADTLLGDAPRAMPVPFDASDAADQVRVQRVLAIEESVVSLVFGLKGKIDATVEIGVGADRNLVVPLELKTGRAGSSRVAHRAQAMLYAALLAERRAAVDALAAGTPATPTWLHSEALPSGGVALLHYLNPDVGGTEGVRLSWLELCALVSNRNDIVAHLTAPPAVRQMPPVLASTHGCRSCVQLPSCAVYHVANERGNGAYRDGFFADTVARMFGTLSESHLAYFRQWERALSLEEHASFESRRDVWSSSAESRERNGTCFADMRLNRVIDSERGGARVLYEFVRGGVAAEGGGGGELAPRSLLDGAINVGDTVTLSVENGPRGVLVGRVHRISDAAVVVSSRDPLRATARFESAQWRWRVDHEESTASFRGLRANVVQLLLSPRLCRLLVDLVPPEFGVSDGAPLLPSVHAMLNEAQRAAIERVRTARDYVLIHGMPGTGKSTTVAALLIQLIADGRSVLLAAHTHAAVDTVLVKLIEAGVSFMRLASNADSVHPAVLPYVPDASAGVEDAVADGASPSRFARPRTVAQLAELVESEPLVAVTCLGVHHPLLARRRFDVCVVDEASQLTQPAIVGALLCADRFVLVGDHQQLPPVVRNAEARLAGLDVSLFRVLSERYASATVELELEYRMNDDIVAVANALVYNGALRCGDERVAQARLHLPHLSARPRAAASFAHLDDWLERLLRAETTAAFLDTGAVAGARDSRATGGRAAASMSNAGEAALVRTVVVAFVACGLDARDIGVVTPYRAQVRRIGAALAGGPEAAVEVSTVDKFQGRDKQCIVVSLVRANDQRDAGPLLADWRRINVAVTRARVKLILIGSAATASSSPALSSLLLLARHGGWLIELPEHATRMYN